MPFDMKVADFYPPPLGMELGVIWFLSVFLSASLSVAKNFNVSYNVWTTRDRDFIFGMNTNQMKTFQITLGVMTLWPWLWPSYYK